MPPAARHPGSRAAPPGSDAPPPRSPRTKRRLFGVDRSGPPPEATLSGHPLNPWTLPNAIGFARLAGIPVFLAVALNSSGGTGALAAVLHAVIGWADYLDGFVARLTGPYSRIGGLADPGIAQLPGTSRLGYAGPLRR